ncbi:LLM class flavin-dependent oxidoreductase [Amycolatopsis jejuensis]|uniref:LLM class flavin-dependent oxidoreductase n=1 Tax=Amycolatopsis jejuensis TaxID=330084 RepID=UPI0005255953|nr:LLM class flavin-dependent oxidoreductase [Amycolatopsis jejuensis]
MTDTETVEAAKRSLGPVGALLLNIPFAAQPAVGAQREAVRRLERAGYPTVWTNEGVGGRDVFTQLAILLAATERLTFATGVANMWARPPETAHGAATFLADAFPGRFVLGLGIGYPFQAEAVGREYRRPVATARTYLDGMAVVPPITPALDAPYATVLAANGPKMLEAARDGADGALPVIHPPSFTAQVREILGPDKLLAVGIPVALADDPAQAEDQARAFLGRLLALDGPYAAKLARLGYSAANLDTIATEDLVAHGTPADIARQVKAHLAAGADHVRLDPIDPGFAEGVDHLVQIAPALGLAGAGA